MSILKHRNTILFVLACLISLDATILLNYSYSSYISNIDVDASVGIAKWTVLLNGNETTTLDIDLADTITTNSYSMDYVVPGATGAIIIELDPSNIDVAFDYVLELTATNLPSLLCLYSDESMTNQIYVDDAINGTIYASEEDPIEITIYWKWPYNTDDASNALDNAWMDEEASISATLTVTQRIEGDA